MEDLERRLRAKAHQLWQEAGESGTAGYFWQRAAAALREEEAAAAFGRVPIDQQIDRLAGRLAREDDLVPGAGPEREPDPEPEHAQPKSAAKK